MNILIEGLKKVDKSDPSATYYMNDKGEYIISTCGQLHLERVQYDLIHHYAPIKLKFSEPIVTFKEAITYDKLNKAIKPEQKYWFQLLLEKQIKEQEILDNPDDDEEQKVLKKLDSKEAIFQNEDIYVQHCIQVKQQMKQKQKMIKGFAEGITSNAKIHGQI